MNSINKLDYEIETKSTEEQVQNRRNLYKLFEERPLPVEHLLSNMGLYMRSASLVKLLFVNELYEYIIDVPGVIVEAGIWWGQNICLFENLRAIHEPFNKSRRIIGFDTFDGYTGFTDKDVQGDVVKHGGYGVSEGYRSYLDQLVRFHESNNVMGHVHTYELIEGDVTEMVPEYFENHPETLVALLYVDLGLYKPTKACLETIKPRLLPGSVILMDDLNSEEMPGETIAFREVFQNTPFTIRKSRFIPDRSIVVIK